MARCRSYLPEAAEFAWSLDGARLVFHTTAPGDPLFVRAGTDATARQIYVAAPGIHCHFLTWSPDGKFIYFVRGDPPSGDWDIWRLRPTGAGLERLTFHHTRVTYPVLLDARTILHLLWGDATVDRVGAPSISPDGRRIAFIVERGGATQLYTVDYDGQNPKAVTRTLALRGDLAWGPDARSIVGAIVSDGEPRLAKIFLDATPPQSIVSDYSVDPVWSPDGKYFVYTGAQVATIFPLSASAPDGRPYNMPGLILTIGARRVALTREYWVSSEALPGVGAAWTGNRARRRTHHTASR